MVSGIPSGIVDDPYAISDQPYAMAMDRNMTDSYIVAEGKKRGSTRDVRPEAAHDKFYTVLRVHPGDAILTDNWHTNEVLDHAKKNFEGYTFQMRTLEAWGATVENDRRGYYTAGGRVWILDLEPAAGKKPRVKIAD